jgi:transcriptional regulator with XRE-family HTH domain
MSAIVLLVETKIHLVGQMIKDMRLKRGFTLEEIAERSGCTHGFISQVENNKALPSLTTLYSIAEALKTNVSDFFPNAIDPTKVTRHDNRGSFHFEGSAIVYSLLTTKFHHAGLSVFLLTYKPANQALPTDELRMHMGEEFIYVLSGVLRLYIGGKHFDLYQDDSAYFVSTQKHRLENFSDQPTIALSMITPSLF